MQKPPPGRAISLGGRSKNDQPTQPSSHSRSQIGHGELGRKSPLLIVWFLGRGQVPWPLLCENGTAYGMAQQDRALRAERRRITRLLLKCELV